MQISDKVHITDWSGMCKAAKEDFGYPQYTHRAYIVRGMEGNLVGLEPVNNDDPYHPAFHWHYAGNGQAYKVLWHPSRHCRVVSAAN